MKQNKWMEKWSVQQHVTAKKELFNTIDRYLKFAPKRILDIGCGLAREAEFFQKKYKSELYLLDGDFEDTSSVSRDIKYGTVDNFKFYNRVDDLKESYDTRGMKYTFVDANNINIPSDIKFDLILSNVSCGFHYPANTYKSLVQAHSDENTKMIFDLRTSVQHPDVNIVNLILQSKKYIKAEIKFN